jgi:hypothetical protein
LIFAESLNDSKSIASLLVAANERLSRRVIPVPRPVSLTRTAGPDAVRDWVGELRRTVTAYKAAGTRIGAVLVHRDADRFDPLGEVEQSLGKDLQLVPGNPVVPVRMIEAWWFLFPDAVEAVRPRAWRGKLPRRARDVERIERPKAELERLTGRSGGPAYAEADSISIAENVLKLSLVKIGSCASYDRFVTLAEKIT